MQKRLALVVVIMVFLMTTLLAGCGGGGSSSSSSSSPANKNQIVITPSYTADATASAIAVRYANAYRISGAKLATATVPNQTVKLLTCDPGINATTSSDGITLTNTTATGDLHFTIGATGAAGCFNFTALSGVAGKVYVDFEVDITGGGYIRAFNGSSTAEAAMVMNQAYAPGGVTVSDAIKSLYATTSVDKVYFQVTLPKKAAMKIYNIFLYMETTATGFAKIERTITGGSGASGDRTYTVTNASELKTALANAAGDGGPSLIRVNGEITFVDWCAANGWTVKPTDTKYTYSGYRMININSDLADLTIVGVGTAGIFNGVGFKVTGNNIIIQNVTVRQVLGQDGIQINGGTYVKIDHCELWNWANAIETSPSDATKDRYDELISLKNNAQGVILAWNYLHGSYKTILVGSNDDADALADRKLIMHHNYINNCGSRLPLYRGGYAHIYNNYFVGVTGSGINCRSGAHLKITQNYFLNCKNPIGYFYDDNRSETGYWDVDANSYSGCSGACPTASTCTVTFESGYTPAVDAAAAVPGKVKAGAGVGK
jgi:pectate lyase